MNGRYEKATCLGAILFNPPYTHQVHRVSHNCLYFRLNAILLTIVTKSRLTMFFDVHHRNWRISRYLLNLWWKVLWTQTTQRYTWRKIYTEDYRKRSGFSWLKNVPSRRTSQISLVRPTTRFYSRYDLNKLVLCKNIPLIDIILFK